MNENKLFYVWVFSHQLKDYEAVSVHNTREEGEHALTRLKKGVEDTVSGAVLEETLKQFTDRATGCRLGR